MVLVRRLRRSRSLGSTETADLRAFCVPGRSLQSKELEPDERMKDFGTTAADRQLRRSLSFGSFEASSTSDFSASGYHLRGIWRGINEKAETCEVMNRRQHGRRESFDFIHEDFDNRAETQVEEQPNGGVDLCSTLIGDHRAVFFATPSSCWETEAGYQKRATMPHKQLNGDYVEHSVVSTLLPFADDGSHLRRIRRDTPNAAAAAVVIDQRRRRRSARFEITADTDGTYYEEGAVDEAGLRREKLGRQQRR